VHARQGARAVHFLFDVRAMTDVEIMSMATTASLRLFLLFLRNIRSPHLVEMLHQWHDLFRRLMQEPTALRLLELLLTYLVKAVPEMTRLRTSWVCGWRIRRRSSGTSCRGPAG